MPKRIINVIVLPGEPLDGSGKVCVHLFVPDESGPFVEPSALHMVDREGGGKQLVTRATRGRLACDPKRTVAQTTRGKVTVVVLRTDDPRAASCSKCRATADYSEILKRINTPG